MKNIVYNKNFWYKTSCDKNKETKLLQKIKTINKKIKSNKNFKLVQRLNNIEDIKN